MKKTIIMAAFALAVMAAPAMAQKDGKGMKDPKARMERVAEKLQFTDAQRAHLTTLNKKYEGTDVDRKKYREEFRAILTDAQKQQMAEWRAKHKGKKGMKNRKAVN